MAVKYKRDPDVKFNWNVRGRSMEATRKKTLMIYGGLGIMFFAIFALQHITGNLKEWQESRTGTATVLRKIVRGTDTDSPAYSIECEVQVVVTAAESIEDTPTIALRDKLLVNLASWEAIEEGTQIQVVYAVNEDYSRMRIENISLGLPVLITE